MFQSHYMSKTVRALTGTARCVYNVYFTKAERDALFRDAPVMTGKVIFDWYDREKRLVCIRCASAAEANTQAAVAFSPTSVKSAKMWTKIAGLYYAQITSNGERSYKLPFDLPFLFSMHETGATLVNVRGVPHLVWRLPNRDEAEAPKMRKANREKLYNPEENPSSDVRYVTVKSYRAEQEATQSASKPAYSGWGRTEPAKSKTSYEVEVKTSNGSAGKGTVSPVEALRLSIARVNQLAGQIGNVQLAVADGKLRASVVTKVEL